MLPLSLKVWSLAPFSRGLLFPDVAVHHASALMSTILDRRCCPAHHHQTFSDDRLRCSVVPSDRQPLFDCHYGSPSSGALAPLPPCHHAIDSLSRSTVARTLLVPDFQSIFGLLGYIFPIFFVRRGQPARGLDVLTTGRDVDEMLVFSVCVGSAMNWWGSFIFLHSNLGFLHQRVWICFGLSKHISGCGSPVDLLSLVCILLLHINIYIYIYIVLNFLAASFYQKTEARQSRSPSAIVIGGGFAGIAAPHALKNAAFQVVLLESQDRIGGRVHTDYSFGFPVDMGAAWLHGVCNENPLASWIGRLGLPIYRTSCDNSILYDHDLESYALFDGDGHQVPQDLVEKVSKVEFEGLGELRSKDEEDEGLGELRSKDEEDEGI
ncbi:hypothetical protein ZIOFF_009715 [Zingiber officinale]|uniref:Amine oxidase domain-containing protein n=1 Tax=Zingiber officinale TaxID=94328 RepID=A0A8J5HUD9_ZINOF|nr:hypothetical protein ZIOFF_009715 [Zingiber officinale]